MTAAASPSWEDANQRELLSALARVRVMLERHPRDRSIGDDAKPDLCDPPSALATLCGAFNLSPFERDLLLLCAGAELDAKVAPLIAAACGEPQRSAPTFGLALAVLPGAHWSALSSTAPLRRWRLIEVRSGELLTNSPLRIDERVLHFLAGVHSADERLAGLCQPVSPGSLIPESHRAAAEHIARLWARPQRNGRAPLVLLCGDRAADQRDLAAAACAALGLALDCVRSQDVPASAAERDALARLCEREAILSNRALLLDAHDGDIAETTRAVAFLETLHSLAFVACRDRPAGFSRETVRVDVAPAAAPEQHALWRVALGPLGDELNGSLEETAGQFQLSAREIGEAGERLRASLDEGMGGPADSDRITVQLWDICRSTARARMESLAQRIEPAACWDDLVLPESHLRTLHEVSAHVRQRMRVYEQWGFAARSTRGLGISALFTGPSGTGKTMAAEVIARELRLDLFRIDLSAVVSKYIGETEKNLRRVFDAAEAGSAILLFDEADALFGKRSEVKDAHDRYANIEVGYLLQRMEAYRGLAILTTNLKHALDTAFMRRLRFVVPFPFPDVDQRAEIWRRVFPAATPTDGLDPEKLAQLNVSGGNIRNVALSAAFLAADAGQPVQMRHMLQAARSECAKLERTPNEMEIRGWT